MGIYSMKHNVLWFTILFAASVGMAGCNGELEEGAGEQPLTVQTNPTDPVVPTVPVKPTDPIEFAGTWENKDEDGDGVPDEQDDYPFDASRFEYEMLYEEEFNNNVLEANSVGGLPFKIKGTISESADIDDFKFIVTDSILEQNTPITFILFKDEFSFRPSMAIIKNDGIVLQHIDLAIANVGRIGRAISFMPMESGEYNLSVSDMNSKESIDFTYQIEAFVDTDKDGVSDIKEISLGMNHLIQDMDRDGIADGNEYHVFVNQSSREFDIDNDMIPNWLDSDSDSDGISDNLEKTTNLDLDLLPSFVDLDSDNNGISDTEETSVEQMLTKDSDGDGIFNFQDLDDDGDLLFDIYDDEPKSRLAYFENSNDPEIVAIQYEMTSNKYIVNRVRAHRPAILIGNNLQVNNAFIIISKGDEYRPVTNIKVNETNGGTLSFIVPDFENIKLSGEDISIFLVVNGKRTSNFDVELMHTKTPIVYDFEPKNASVGDKIYINGENIKSSIDIIFDDISTSIVKETEASGYFIVPSLIGSGDFYLGNVYGKSNVNRLIVEKSMSISINTPAVYESLTGTFSITNSDDIFNNILDLNGESIVKTNLRNTYTVWWNEKIKILQKIVMDEDENVVFSLDSTIESYALNGLIHDKDREHIALLRGELATLPEYEAFTQYFKDGLNNNVESFLSSDNFELAVKVSQLQDALLKFSRSSLDTNN